MKFIKAYCYMVIIAGKDTKKDGIYSDIARFRCDDGTSFSIQYYPCFFHFVEGRYYDFQVSEQFYKEHIGAVCC